MKQSLTKTLVDAEFPISNFALSESLLTILLISDYIVVAHTLFVILARSFSIRCFRTLLFYFSVFSVCFRFIV